MAAGKDVAAAAGGAQKKTVLELGGADAYLVLADADPVKAAEVATAARMVNAGQSCIAGKRFIAVREIREAFRTRACGQDERDPDGLDPRDAATKFGPMQSIAARDEIHTQVQESIAKGARLLTGGERRPTSPATPGIRPRC